MRSRTMLLTAAVGLAVACCGGGRSEETTQVDVATTTSAATIAQDAATAETAPFHAMPADSVVVTGTAECGFGREGVNAEAGDDSDFVTCALDMSDPRVSGTETHDRFRYSDGETALVWVAEEAVITNTEGTWRGSVQAVDDGTPIGEAHYVGEGAYDGLEFHYYFTHAAVAGEAELHGWISGREL